MSTMIIATRKNVFIQKMKKILKKAIPQEVISSRENKKRQPLQRRNFLHFQLLLAEHCNLNCKYCGALSPLVKKAKFPNIDIIEKDFKRLSYLTGKRVETISLLGGEPLLYPDLVKVLVIAREYFIGNINIVTNGILLLKQNNIFWDTCRKNNIQISVSMYPVNINYEEIRNRAISSGLGVYFSNEETKTMWKIPFDLEGGQDLQESFGKCIKANWCITLKEGKLYTCHTIPYSDTFNAYFDRNMQISKNDYIDIYEVKDINEILDFLCKPVPFCRYCNFGAMVDGLEWGHSEKDISEWT